MLAGDPLVAAAELRLGAAFVEVLDEGAQHRGGTYRGCRAFEPSSATSSPPCSTRGPCGATSPATTSTVRGGGATSLELIYASGEYRPYDDIVVEAAGEVDLNPALPR